MDANQQIERTNTLFERVSSLIEQSRQYVTKAINTAMVATYFGIGRYIIEDEQEGQYRAAYGQGVLKELSQKLTERFGKGWSVETLTKCRKFYNVYAISSNKQTKLSTGSNSSPAETKSDLVTSGDEIQNKFVLPWTHYLILMRIDNPEERRFYEIEAAKQTSTHSNMLFACPTNNFYRVNFRNGSMNMKKDKNSDNPATLRGFVMAQMSK